MKRVFAGGLTIVVITMMVVMGPGRAIPPGSPEAGRTGPPASIDVDSRIRRLTIPRRRLTGSNP